MSGKKRKEAWACVELQYLCQLAVVGLDRYYMYIEQRINEEATLTIIHTGHMMPTTASWSSYCTIMDHSDVHAPLYYRHSTHRPALALASASGGS